MHDKELRGVRRTVEHILVVYGHRITYRKDSAFDQKGRFRQIGRVLLLDLRSDV
jgi:hypothetical protein